MGLKVEIDPEDSFSALISLFLNCNKITQEQFAHKILTTRQSISSLMSINSITEVSESMLFRLYYYFKEVYDSIENQKKGKLSLKAKLEYDVSIAIINVINKEITRRYNEETSTEKKNKPKARGRKK